MVFKCVQSRTRAAPGSSVSGHKPVRSAGRPRIIVVITNDCVVNTRYDTRTATAANVSRIHGSRERRGTNPARAETNTKTVTYDARPSVPFRRRKN